MKRILLDTNIYCDAMRGDSVIVSKLQRIDVIAMNPVIIGELLAGFRGGNQFEKNLNELNEFLDSPRVQIFSMTYSTADFYSQIFTQLKKAGTPIPTNDIWIAATVFEHGLKFFTSDKHFSKIDGLMFL